MEDDERGAPATVLDLADNPRGVLALFEENRTLRQQLLDAQRALAWLLWQQPYREALITEATMRDMPADVLLVSEAPPRSGGLRLWVQKGPVTSGRTSD